MTKSTFEPIPDDRPVYGSDINAFAESQNFTTLDTSYLLGVYMSVLARMTSTQLTDRDVREGFDRPGAERPIADPKKALLLRLLSRHAAYCPIKPAYTPATVFDAIQQVPGRTEIKSRHFGLMLGCELSSAYRWWGGGGVTPIVGRLLTIIMNMFNDLNDVDRCSLIEELISLTEIEARNRNIEPAELWEKGSWTSGKKGK